jgi:chemotaxis protein MotA
MSNVLSKEDIDALLNATSASSRNASEPANVCRDKQYTIIKDNKSSMLTTNTAMNKSLIFALLLMFVCAGALTYFSFMSDRIVPLWAYCSAVLVFTFLCLLASFGLRVIRQAVDTVKIAFNNKYNDAIKTTGILVHFSELARRSGILGIHPELENLDDLFLRKGLSLAVDEIEPLLIERILNNEISGIASRHEDNFLFWQNAAINFAIWGTLAALCANTIIVFVFGTFMSVCVCMPIANVLKRMSKKEILQKEIVVRGIMSIQAGDHPRIIRQQLAASFGESFYDYDPMEYATVSYKEVKVICKCCRKEILKEEEDVVEERGDILLPGKE